MTNTTLQDSTPKSNGKLTFREEIAAFVDAGCSIIPIGNDKKPRIPGETRAARQWEPFKTRRATPDELDAWFRPGQREAAAIVCGKVSGERHGGYLVALDLERVDDYARLVEAAPNFDDGMAIQATPGGGAHLIFISRERVGNPKIIDPKLPTGDPGHHVGDIKGEGGYVLAAPSLHPNGGRYEWLAPFPPTLVVEDGLSLIEGLMKAIDYRVTNRPDAGETGEAGPSEEPADHAADLLTQDTGTGERHTALVRLAGLALSKGRGSIDAERELQNWNLARCKPPLPTADVAVTVADVFSRYDPPIQTFRSGNASDGEADRPSDDFDDVTVFDLFHREIPPTDWLLADFIGREKYTLITGESGLGKSWFVLALILSAIHRRRYLDIETTPIRAVYIDEENGMAEAKRRLLRLYEGMGIEPSEGQDDLRFMIDQGVVIGTPNVARIVRYCLKHRINTVIFDSMARLLDGDENSTKDVTEFHNRMTIIRNACRAEGLPLTMIMVHHPNKAGDAYRGSYDLKAYPDTFLNIKESGDAIEVKAEKMRFAPIPASIGYQMTDAGDGTTLTRVDGGGEHPKGKGRGKEVKGNKLRVLRATVLCHTGEPVPWGKINDVVQNDGDRPMGRSSYNLSLNDLEHMKLLEKIGETGYVPTLRGRLLVEQSRGPAIPVIRGSSEPDDQRDRSI